MKIRLKNLLSLLIPSRLIRSASLTGFTLIEFLIVGATIILLSGLFLPVGFGFFQTQSVDEARENVVSVLRRAQNQALLQKNDSPFGVKFMSNSYVLFQGDSYLARQPSEDEIFLIPSGVSMSGLGEVVFSKFIGGPSAVGIISTASGSYSKDIDINSQGKIEGL